MKTRSIFLITLLLALMVATALPTGTVKASSTTIVRKPAKYETIQGADSGNPVSVLRVQDQSSSVDDPSKYVLFSTPGKAYRGTQDFSLGSAYQPAEVTGISLKVNFKGPAKKTQVWTWKIYDWNARTWVKIGDNAKAKPGVWKLLSFGPVPYPQRYINANGKIRVLVTSNSSSKDAKIDYEILRVTVAPSSGCAPEENSAFEAQVLSLINAERAKEGLSPLTRNDKLDAAAQRHSNDMACNNFMSHYGSDGSTPYDRMSQAGYNWYRAAENIAASYPTPESVVAAWMGSSSHKSNILSPYLEDIGIAYAYKSSATWGCFWTTDFGALP